MGRLTLNILLSFAQFEREIISERTRDKVAATRKKGKWSGGQPILGFDADPVTNKLVINHEEAQRVRAIFRLYAEHGSLLRVVQELSCRGWVNKRHSNRKGIAKGGAEFTRTGTYSPIHFWPARFVTRQQFTLVSTKLSSKNQKVRYRYYTCVKAQKLGWATCPSKSISAGQIEMFVVERTKSIGSDPALQEKVMEFLSCHHEEEHEALVTEERLLVYHASHA